MKANQTFKEGCLLYKANHKENKKDTCRHQ